ncbi:Pup--protein ligase [[Brevibacterium] flavum]|uniref:Pup--protein ligase n=2 Tax=Corynebacteriaceae TaxID=1653 RepID=A0A0F6WQQ2_9CORY|nr:Pup--protein ligase [Corynebacterium glutamicum]AKF27473.1 Pup--protein ligase [[Brevibacterium] flavum]KEI23218.1 Pup--protein ligase [Corynebacterium glutamicum ATCC 14067]KIH73635.1 Pup--protein ligase [Corynebacterium glutamicum]OKX90630.1 Pup--protein ligase [Corynebacterium glutamicum]
MSTVESALTRRIMGIETEYGLTFVDGDSKKLRPDEIARRMFRPIVEKYSSSNIFIPNGSRLYLDVGSHPEYATAECDNLTQLINFEKAGDVIADRMAVDAEESLAKEDIAGQVYLFKNNVDSVGNSYGCHENYLVGRSMPLKALGKRLMPFLITRQLICGAGRIHHPNPLDKGESFPLGYCISQRSDHVWEGVSSATTRSRPIINTRDEPHADSHSYRRLHVIVGDANMAEPSIALKVGSTLLVLEMIEADFGLPSLELANDIASIREISRDATGSTLLSLKDGTTMTALQIQQVVFEHASKWLEQRPEPEFSGTSNTEMARVLDLWGRMLKAIESGDFSEVDTEIDWVIKKKLIDRFIQRGNLGLDDPKLAQVDLTYHDIRPGRGLFSVLQSRGMIKRWTTDEAILAAVDTAPDTTRAHLRGRILKAADTVGVPVTVDWMRHKVNRPEPQSVELGDPFSAVNSEVDQLIEYMTVHAESYRS